jgi:hypothetical protein
MNRWNKKRLLKSLELAPSLLKGVLQVSDIQKVPFRGFKGK